MMTCQFSGTRNEVMESRTWRAVSWGDYGRQMTQTRRAAVNYSKRQLQQLEKLGRRWLKAELLGRLATVSYRQLNWTPPPPIPGLEVILLLDLLCGSLLHCPCWNLKGNVMKGRRYQSRNMAGWQGWHECLQLKKTATNNNSWRRSTRKWLSVVNHVRTRWLLNETEERKKRKKERMKVKRKNEWMNEWTNEWTEERMCGVVNNTEWIII